MLFFGALFEFAISRPLLIDTPIEHMPLEKVVAQVIDIFAGDQRK